jgi:monofunctional glycosyltransferase
VKTAVSKIFRFLKKLFLYLFILHLLYLVLLRWIDPPITLTQLGSFLSGDGLKRDYVSRDEISSHAKLAVIASEDQLFPDHDGFDWKSIKKATEYNRRKPGRIRGASTISQQVAKNVFLWQGRSWFRKGLEAYFTFMIELLWSKQRILEVYLNVAEMGKGVFGIEAAAQDYFKKPAKNLSRQESAMIAASLPNPQKFTVKPISGFVANKYPRILQQMNALDDDPDILAVIHENRKNSK